MPVIRDKTATTPALVETTGSSVSTPEAEALEGRGHEIRDGERLEAEPELSLHGAVKDSAGAKKVTDLAPAMSGVGGTGVWRGAVEAKLADGPSSTTAKVALLLDRYGIDAAINRPQERILHWAAGLHEKLNLAADPQALVDHVMEVDARRECFMLEGAFRLYKKRYDDPIDDQLGVVKGLEDELGAVDYATAMRDAGREAGLPTAALAHLDGEVESARQDLAARLADGWLPDADGRIPKLAELLETITGIDWDGIRKDRKVLKKELGRRLEKLASADYDMDALEEGVHELRRQIRWFPIYFSALAGIAELDATLNPIAEYEPLLRDPIAESKYAKLPPGDPQTEPLRIAKSLYLANTKHIEELGDLKDGGQVIEGLARALLESGVAASPAAARQQALAALGKSEADLHHIHERSAEIYHEIKRTELFEHLLAGIRS